MDKCLAIGLVLLAAAPVLHAQVPASTGVQSNQVETFIAQLQRASQADDRNAIAALIRYPITISIGGLRVPFADAASFLERYDDIFNPPLRDAIARGSAIETQFIVIAPVEGHLRITAIAVPEFASGGSTAAAPVADAPKGTARSQEPRRIAIRVGPRPTQIPGLLARDATDVYILFLPKGRLAAIRLERARAGAAVISVVHVRTGAPLGARTSADGRFVSGRPSEDGDYRVEVRRTGAMDDGYLPYMLSISLR